MIKIYTLALLLASFGCAGDDRSYDGTDDESSEWGTTAEALSTEIAGSGAATGRFMQGYRCADAFGQSCDTGLTCAPPQEVCVPQRVNVQTIGFCSTDATVRAQLTQLATDMENVFGGTGRHFAAGSSCSSSQNITFTTTAFAKTAGDNDLRSYAKLSVNANAAQATTVPFSGASSNTYNIRQATSGTANINLAAINVRGANATEDANLLKMAVRHIGVQWMGAGARTSSGTASQKPFSSLSSVPALFTSGEQCRILNQTAAPIASVFSTSHNCANN